MIQLPTDDEKRSVGSRAKAIVHYRFNSDHWEYRDSTGVDVGIDCQMELTEDDKWTGNVIDCQVKGRSKPKFNIGKSFISLEMKVSTVNYGLSRSSSFVLLVVDMETEIVYYLPIQEYFIANPMFFDKLRGEQDQITLRVPTDNIVSKDDNDLVEVAKSRYIGGPGIGLHRAL